MNYQKHYDLLIIKAQSRIKPNCYCEKHHILPKSLGGSNDPNNLVILTTKEHYIAHLLLAKIYGGKMWIALNVMLKGQKHKNSKIYSTIRKNHSKNISGKLHPFYGKKHSQETKNKMSKNHADFSKFKNPSFKSIILATNILTKEVKEYCGAIELKLAGFNHSHVYSCISGNRKTHKGHTFSYKNIGCAIW